MITQQDMEQELQSISDNLGNVRVMLRVVKQQEKELMERRNQVRSQLHLLREAVPTFNGTSQPVCLDCVEGDG